MENPNYPEAVCDTPVSSSENDGLSVLEVVDTTTTNVSQLVTQLDVKTLYNSRDWLNWSPLDSSSVACGSVCCLFRNLKHHLNDCNGRFPLCNMRANFFCGHRIRRQLGHPEIPDNPVANLGER